MLNLFKTIANPKAINIGLAIGENKVRALEITGSMSAGRVSAYSDHAVPKGVFSPEGLVDSQGLSKILLATFQSTQFGQFSGTDVVVNLPEARCFVRVIHVDNMPDAEIESAVPFEAESYIPIPIEQVYLDWMKIGEKDGKTALLLVASPKAFVDQVLEGLDGAGLRPTALEVESLAIARSLIPFGSPDNILIADMRTSKTDLIIVEKGVVQFTSTIPVAGASITDSIAKGLEVPTKRAEEIKTEAGFGNTEDYPNLKTLVMPVLNTFLTEIKQVLAFHDQHSAVRVGKIVLAGGAAKLKHLDEFFKSGLESEYPELLVEVGDPTVNLHLQFPEKLSGIEVITYTTAIGLAMKGLKT